jgi:signal transduction histidine kinase
MNLDIQRSPNTIVGATVCTRDVVAQTAGRVQRWFRRTGLFQGFLGASSLSRALPGMGRVVDEGRGSRQELRSYPIESMSLEHALFRLRDEFAPGGGMPFRIFVTGKPKALKPAIQEQICLIGREALVNALRHSEATSIEAEVEYLPRLLRVIVRDNGCGINLQRVRPGRDSRWGLLGMQERAGSIGAELRIWSRPGAGTEVEIAVPGDILAYARA